MTVLLILMTTQTKQNTMTNNINIRGWIITAEPYCDPKVLIDIESPCGKYGSSLALAEDTGSVEDYRTLSKTKAVPASVLRRAQEIEETYYN